MLDTARKEDVLITKRGGDTFRLTYKTDQKSPFNVPGIRTKATPRDILDAVKESRRRDA